MMLVSEHFYKITGKRFLYNIVPLSNIPSIIRYGILCYDEVQRLPHESIALLSVQDRRSKVVVTDNRRLHQYANLYFDYHNPMLSKRRDQNNSICILAIHNQILDVDGCVLTDRNAAAEMVRFLDPIIDMEKIDFAKVYAPFWINSEDKYEEKNHKAIKCAEALIPKKVPYEYVSSACVISETVKEELKHLGFCKPIYVRPDCFF